jgi:acyl carrier protein
MTGIEVKETIRGFLSRYVKSKVEDDQNLFTSGLVNSFSAMELVLFVEKHFKIKVENEDLDLKNFNTVKAIAEFIGRKSGRVD